MSEQVQRGAIRHHKRAAQLNDFSGIQLRRNITPTDIDLAIHYYFERGLFIGEGKLKGAEFPKGQKHAIEGIIDNCRCAAMAVVWEHDTTADEVVDVANCKVIGVYDFNSDGENHWRLPNKYEGTVLQAIEFFERRL